MANLKNNKRFRPPDRGEIITSSSTNNTYKIKEIIGEGNFSIVYACSDFWDNKLAVKVLKPKGTYEEVKKKAEGEFHRLMELRHPNITFVYDAFEYRDTFLYCDRKMFWSSIRDL